VEFASIFRQFGAAVTLIEVLPRLVPGEDAAVSTELEKAFRKRGITVRTSTEVRAVRVGTAEVAIDMTDSAGEVTTLSVDKILVAAGRRPVTDGLGVEEAGLVVNRGFVVVDDFYRTSLPGVSAVGDVIAISGRPHPQLAHLASAEGMRVAERIAGRESPAINYDHVPSCTYCDPEIGSVGLTEAQAAERGLTVRTGTFPFSALGRARIAGETQGFVKVVVDAEYDQVLGVHIVGPRATELVAAATLALGVECTVEEFLRTMYPHPTMSEAIGEAAHAAGGAAIHL
jgi:dihydrolipoamide dehydrogenase